MTTNELLGALFAPALLSSNPEALRTARRLFWQRGMLSHVFARRFSLLCYLTPWIIRHPLPKGASAAILAVALSDFAAEQRSVDRTPLLFLTKDKQFPTLTEQQLGELEREFVICRDPEDVRLPFESNVQGDSSL